jgi:hypothetical protein
MPDWLFRILNFFYIVERCPNCDSAWSGGVSDPEKLTHCLICGNRKGEITGWVWGLLVDPFCWIGQYYTSRNLRVYERNKDIWNVRRGEDASDGNADGVGSV